MATIIKPLRQLMDQHPKLWSGDLQWQIARLVTGDSNLFEFQSEANQEAICARIQEEGITKIINQATNQTDIMEEIAESNQNAVFQLLSIAGEFKISEEQQINTSSFCGVGGKTWEDLLLPEAVQVLDQINHNGAEDLIKQADRVAEHEGVLVGSNGSGISGKSLQTSADSGEIVDRKQMAAILDRQIKSAMTDIYIATSEIIDHKLYQELGHSTAASYFETLAISERKAYQYAVIGRELRPHAYLSDGKENPKAKQTANLGYSKLEEIVRHAKDQIDNLIQNGQIQIGGETLSREEIESKSVRDLRNQLKEAKAAKEENERLKYEKKHLERSVEDLKEDNERLAKYKTGITQEKEVREALESFSAHISDAIRFARGVKLDELDEHLQAEVVKRINTGFDLLERYSAEHAEIFTVHAD
jgi:hypothetical protein